MNYTFSAPVTDAQRQRDALLGALVGLARSTVNAFINCNIDKKKR